MPGTKRSGRPSEKLDPNLEVPPLGKSEEEVHRALDWAWEMLLKGKIPPRHSDAATKLAAQKVAMFKATKKIDERIEKLEKWLDDLQMAGLQQVAADRYGSNAK